MCYSTGGDGDVLWRTSLHSLSPPAQPPAQPGPRKPGLEVSLTTTNRHGEEENTRKQEMEISFSFLILTKYIY